MRAVTITFELDSAAPHVMKVEPASCGRNSLPVLELIRLRLANTRLVAPVERVELVAHPARLDGTQLVLFGGRRRDPNAAARSIARLRAAFGDDAVTRAELCDAWIPERSFRWRATTDISAPRIAEPSPTLSMRDGRLIRRLRSIPEPLGSTREGQPRLPSSLVALCGPYRLQNGWWEAEFARDYFFAECEDGSMWWLFREPRHGRWFLHARID